MVGSFVSEETGTWFEICEDQPNFYTGAYTNGQRIPATWDSSISYLGMDDRGWICSVSLFRMDSGRTQRETLAMMPADYGGCQCNAHRWGIPSEPAAAGSCMV